MNKHKLRCLIKELKREFPLDKKINSEFDALNAIEYCIGIDSGVAFTRTIRIIKLKEFFEVKYVNSIYNIIYQPENIEELIEYCRKALKADYQ